MTWAPAPARLIATNIYSKGTYSPLPAARGFPSFSLNSFNLITLVLGRNSPEVSLSWTERFMLFYCIHKNYPNRGQYHAYPQDFALRLVPAGSLFIIFFPCLWDLLSLCPRGEPPAIQDSARWGKWSSVLLGQSSISFQYHGHPASNNDNL